MFLWYSCRSLSEESFVDLHQEWSDLDLLKYHCLLIRCAFDLGYALCLSVVILFPFLQ